MKNHEGKCFFRFAAMTSRISEVDGQLEEYNDESDKLTRQLDGLYDQQKVRIFE